MALKAEDLETIDAAMVGGARDFYVKGKAANWIPGQISSRPKTRPISPQMVVKSKGKFLISGKFRLVKYYNLARLD